MRRRTSRTSWAVMAVVLVAASPPPAAPLQQPEPKPAPAPPAADPSPKRPAWETALGDTVKPTPLEPIPDDPPPHEGALFEMPYRIGPLDLLHVEVLEALPGRAIPDERLVRQDGTVSLGWYGDVHVAGLTLKQAKVQVIRHLRGFVTDQALGLIAFDDLMGGARMLDPLPTLPRDEVFDVVAGKAAEENLNPPGPGGANPDLPADPFKVFLIPPQARSGPGTAPPNFVPHQDQKNNALPQYRYIKPEERVVS